jgi:hypothetical protein
MWSFVSFWWLQVSWLRETVESGRFFFSCELRVRGWRIK